MSVALALAGLLAVTSTPFPSTRPDEAIDKIFSRYDRPDSPGCALAVIDGGEVIYAKGYGSADLEYGIPITPETIFHVASVSKQFTAFAAILLETRGRLSLDDDIRQHIPELPDFGIPITLRHLIHHTSGLRDQWDLLVLAGWRMDDVITHADVMRLVCRQRELNFKPGERYLYCNTGYTLIAEIVKRVTGQSLREFADQAIFKPLGMDHTHFHDDHQHIVPNRAYSYAQTSTGGFRKSVLSYAVVGATSLFTTVLDLARWQENFDTAEVGGEEAIEAMLTRGKLNNGETLSYACGLVRGTYRGLPTIGHSGGDAGFRSHLVRFPEQELSIAILGNLASLDPASLAYRVADLYLEDELAPPDAEARPSIRPRAARVQRSTEELSGHAGLYVDVRAGVLARVDVRNGRLELASERTGRQPLVAVGEHRFAPLDSSLGVEYLFEVDEQGKSSSLAIIEGSVTALVLRAAAPPQSSIAELSELVGDYYSEELDETYHVALEGEHLVVRRSHHDDEVLRPAFRDGFASGGGRLIFTRDPEQRVSGCLVSSSRVLNLRFVRTTD